MRALKKNAGLSTREKALGIARGFPEVVIKIESRVKKGTQTKIRGFRKLLDSAAYISRKGVLEMENQDGILLVGQEEIRQELEGWKTLSNIPEEETGVRAATRIVLSVQGDIDREKFKEACREWAQTWLEGYDWILCAHEDTPVAHVHILLRSRSFITGKIFKVFQNELYLIRETLACSLKSRGIEANATSRRSRGEGPSRICQGEYYTLIRGETTKRLENFERKVRQYVTDALHGKPLPESEVLTRARAAQAEVKRQAFAFARALLATGKKEDAELARAFARHYENLPVMESLSERTLRLILEEARGRSIERKPASAEKGRTTAKKPDISR